MTRRSQRLRRNSLPFRYADDDLQFEIESYEVDDGNRREVDLSAGERSLNLSEVSEWDEIVLHGRIGIPNEVVECVFPETERDQPPARLYVALQCHDTIYRTRSFEEADPTPGEEYNPEITLTRHNLRGEVILKPYLIRRTEGPTGTPYAATPNTRVAGASPFYTYVDAFAADDLGLMEGEETTFAGTDHLPNEERLYYLDFRNEERPKLWLNADHPRVTDVLAAEGSVGAEPRFRDVILDQIQYAVWTQLIFRAAAAIDPDGKVRYEWQRTVIDSFAPEMYDANDTTEAALALRRDVHATDRIDSLAGRIDGAVQEYVDPRAQLIKLMEEGLQI